MTDSTASDENLTERLRIFGVVALDVSLLGVVVHIVSVAVLAGGSKILSPALYVQAAGCLFPLFVWLSCRRPRGKSFLRVIEAVGLLGSAAAFAVMGQLLSQISAVDFNGSSAEAFAAYVETNQERFAVLSVYTTAMIYILRSALVPSRARYTGWLGVGIGVVILAGPMCLVHDASYDRFVRISVSRIALWTLAVAVCTTLSAVIHGLRREIANARKLGQYTLGEKIGEGGMGAVYRATHAFLRRPTAVKLLLESRAGDQAIKRFEREVQLTSQLTHPNTITIYDYGRTPDGIFYYAMELLNGPSLQGVIDSEGAQPADRVVRVLSMVVGALAEAHSQGLIHRDIKPANIILSTRGGIKDFATVLDFGLVRDLGDTVSPDVTSVGTLVGTPMYLAPELIQGRPPSPQSDLYALACVGYLMLTGQTVFEGETVVEVCANHLHAPVKPPSEMLGRPIDPALEALIVKGLAKDPDARFVSAKEMLRTLQGLGVSQD